MIPKKPHKDPFEAPEGYFDNLSDQIIERYHEQKSRTITWLRVTAAAAVLILGMSLFIWNKDIPDTGQFAINQSLEDEIELLINSGYWQAEDILAMADNPNAILDEILAEEWAWMDEEDYEDWSLGEW